MRILKKSEGEAEGKSWKTLIHQMQINNSVLSYSDPDNKLEFKMAFHQSAFKGKIDPDLLDITMEIDASMDSLAMNTYSLPEAVDFNLRGQYIFDFQNSSQQFNDWEIKNKSVSLTGKGNIRRNESDESIDIAGSWSDAQPEEIRKWLSPKLVSSWKDYVFFGESDGRFEIKGKSSKTESPIIKIQGELKQGGFQSNTSKEEIKNVNLDFLINQEMPGIKTSLH